MHRLHYALFSLLLIELGYALSAEKFYILWIGLGDFTVRSDPSTKHLFHAPHLLSVPRHCSSLSIAPWVSRSHHQIPSYPDALLLTAGCQIPSLLHSSTPLYRSSFLSYPRHLTFLFSLIFTSDCYFPLYRLSTVGYHSFCIALLGASTYHSLMMSVFNSRKCCRVLKHTHKTFIFNVSVFIFPSFFPLSSWVCLTLWRPRLACPSRAGRIWTTDEWAHRFTDHTY